MTKMPLATRIRRWSAVATVALAFLATSPPVRGDDLSTARARFEAGRAAFRAGRYAEAGEAYEASAAAQPHAAPLVNAAEAWERDGNLVRAAQACDRALALAADATLRAAIQHRLARVTKGVGTISIEGAVEIQVRVDAGHGVAPPARIRLSPGRHHLTYVDTRTQRESEGEVSLAAGEERNVVVTSPPLPAAAQEREPPPPPAVIAPAALPPSEAPPPRRSTGGPPVGAWVAFGAAGAAGAAAGVLGAMTLSSKQTYEEAPTRSALDDFYGKRLGTNLALGAAVVALGIGIVVWVLHDPTSDSTRARIRSPSGDDLLRF